MRLPIVSPVMDYSENLYNRAVAKYESSLPSSKPYKRSSNHLSDVEVDPKRHCTETVMMEANSLNEASGQYLFDQYDYYTGSSSESYSDPIRGIGDLGDLSRALVEADKAEQSHFTSIPDTWIRNVLSPLAVFSRASLVRLLTSPFLVHLFPWQRVLLRDRRRLPYRPIQPHRPQYRGSILPICSRPGHRRIRP